jgi:hypothetical protein
MEKFSFQAPALVGFRVFDGDVIFASAGDFKARLFKRIGQRGSIRDQTLIYLITDPAVERLASSSAVRCLSHLLCLGDTFDVHRIGPTVRLVHQVAQAVERTLITRWGDIQAAPAV